MAQGSDAGEEPQAALQVQDDGVGHGHEGTAHEARRVAALHLLPRSQDLTHYEPHKEAARGHEPLEDLQVRTPYTAVPR